MKFANPEYLLLLLLIPLAIALYKYAIYRRKKNIAAYGDPELVKRLIPSHSTLRSKVIFWLMLVAMALIIIALARPRYGKGKRTITTTGMELVVALDVSNSMLADDIYPSRLDKAKRLIWRMADQLQGNKIALVLFAGEAYVHLPITTDMLSAEMFINSIATGMIKTQGTDIGKAINMSMRCFTPNDEVGKAIVVITDAENHEPGAEEAAKKAADSGKKVFILGIGTPTGARIPLEDGTFLRNKEGEVVVTKLNEEMAINVAKAGNGMYLQVDNSNKAQNILVEELDKMAKGETIAEVYSGYEELFIYAAMLALILLFADIIIKTLLDLNINKRK